LNKKLLNILHVVLFNKKRLFNLKIEVYDYIVKISIFTVSFFGKQQCAENSNAGALKSIDGKIFAQ